METPCERWKSNNVASECDCQNGGKYNSLRHCSGCAEIIECDIPAEDEEQWCSGCWTREVSRRQEEEIAALKERITSLQAQSLIIHQRAVDSCLKACTKVLPDVPDKLWDSLMLIRTMPYAPDSPK